MSNFIFNTKNNVGFTLAEVLITLGIIGVVAAMTIPTLINKTNDIEFKSKLKKEYSTISQVQELLALDNGGDYTASISQCGKTAAAATCYKDVWKTKLNWVKECAGGAAFGADACFPAIADIKTLDGIAAPDSYLDVSIRSGLILSDGTSLIFYSYDGVTVWHIYYPWGFITIDVNGFSKPNTWGKDIYGFVVFSNQIIPTPSSLYPPDGDCNTGTNKGWTCAEKYLSGN